MSATAVSPQSQSGSRILPPLPNADKYATIVTRFAPNPDFVLHLGSIRAIILSHDYARMYKGRFLLRFDDTDPRLKKSALEYYDLIRRMFAGWNASGTPSTSPATGYPSTMSMLRRF